MLRIELLACGDGIMRMDVKIADELHRQARDKKVSAPIYGLRAS
jgi:hypothetical protein